MGGFVVALVWHPSGHTALSLAAKNKRRDIVIALLRAGASLKQEAAAGKSVERWIKDSFGEDEAWRLLEHALLARATAAEAAKLALEATLARERESAAAALETATAAAARERESAAAALEAATAAAARDRESAAATLRRLTERIAALEATAEAI
ncbi:hypothetical protein FNF31_07159 [Cafeteria roenbergensis]|uniref:Uncharacterized protein n=1 Tax=Cafeteria roenbergensis TaxID=33653 RepID=A0A5A8C9K0_CAFRO|nr:hypothetical protein FNF31_07159 [Cafeteria roenbergensis]